MFPLFGEFNQYVYFLTSKLRASFGPETGERLSLRKWVFVSELSIWIVIILS